ncbi:hypothetical protein B0H11DRAFT_1018394 [Mycena galericulata]|nr:hypothetical protein B0H11DRAFT_1018394 [Mycena galericulata]
MAATPPLPQAPQGPFPNPPQRQATQPPFTVGIAAGAEDVKYQAKYKDLKRKVKEIEADNDKLHFKVLQAKRSIQRMKLERAVLYERLQQVPPSPELQDRHPLPPVHPSPHQPPPQHHAIPPNHLPREMDRTPPEYIRTHGGTLRQEGRAGTMDSPMAPGALPHGSHSSRRGSVGGHEPRQLQFMQHLPPVQQDPHRGHTQIHTSPHIPHPNASHERARSPSRGRAHPAPPVYHPHAQQYPDVQQVQQQHPLHSPPLSERDRSRRHDIHELGASHLDSRGRHQNSIPPHSPPSDARTGPHPLPTSEWALVRTSTVMTCSTGNATSIVADATGNVSATAAVHATCALPPWSTARVPWSARSTPNPMRRCPAGARTKPTTRSGAGTHGPTVRARRPGPDPRWASPRPARTHVRSFTRRTDRARLGSAPSFRRRRWTLCTKMDGRNLEIGMEGGGGGGYAPEQSRPPLDSRKRSRNDMDIDDTDDGPPGAMYSRHSDSEPRGSKRYHQASDHM